MKIDEKNVEVIIDALVSRIKSLETDVWCYEERVKKLNAEIERLKGGATV